MFVQIIEGQTNDAQELKQQMDRWNRELRPGARGFLGSTGGVTSDGRAIILARFESVDAARANSGRPEQGEWWTSVEKCFDGEVTFTDSEDVQEFLGGGSDDAGFVQVMKATGVDRAEIEQLDAKFTELASTVRPDLIGGFRVWAGPTTGYDVNYFTTEAEARAGEAAGPPPELEEMFQSFQKVLDVTEFYDLSDPWLI